MNNCKDHATADPLRKGPGTRILIISADFPYPVDTGKKLVLSGFLSYFMARFGKDNVTWLLVGMDRAGVSKLSDHAGIKIVSLPLPHIILRLASLLWHSVICRAKSLQEAMFYSPSMQRKIEQLIDDVGPDIVVYDTIRMGQFIPSRYHHKAILYLEDLFSVRYGRMLEQMQNGFSFGSTVLGNFARFIPGIVRRQIDKSQFIQSMLLEFEQRLVERSERAQPPRFHTSLLLNSGEVKELRNKVAEANIEFVPPFLGIPSTIKRNYDGKFLFIYLGALQYPPNEVGLLEFFDKGLELAINNIPDMEFIIVGKGASQRLIDAVDTWQGRVKLAGYVEDLSPLFSTCCGVLLPMVLGTGVKLKALEAMSRGVPVVSTRMGIDSIPVSHDVECFIEDDLSKFWVWMDKLTDRECNKKMSEAACESFTSNYSQEAVYNIYDTIFNP